MKNSINKIRPFEQMDSVGRLAGKNLWWELNWKINVPIRERLGNGVMYGRFIGWSVPYFSLALS